MQIKEPEVREDTQEPVALVVLLTAEQEMLVVDLAEAVVEETVEDIGVEDVLIIRQVAEEEAALVSMAKVQMEQVVYLLLIRTHQAMLLPGEVEVVEAQLEVQTIYNHPVLKLGAQEARTVEEAQLLAQQEQEEQSVLYGLDLHVDSHQPTLVHNLRSKNEFIYSNRKQSTY